MNTSAVHPNTQYIKFAFMENMKSNIFTKETLIPVSLVLGLIAPVVYVTNLAQRVEQMEARIEVLQTTNVSKEVFQLKMETFETKLDAVLNAVGSEVKK